jgi:hypothetical protein
MIAAKKNAIVLVDVVILDVIFVISLALHVIIL